MNRKNYIKWLLRSWFPIIFVLAIIGVLGYIVPSFSSAIYPYSVVQDYYPNDYYSWLNFANSLIVTDIGIVSAGTGTIMSIGLIGCFVMPFFVFDYRSDKSAADTYLQAPAKPTEIRLIRVFVGLLVIAAVTTGIFWVGNIIKLIRQCNFQGAKTGELPFYFFNYGYYALFNLYLLLIIASTYLFNCTIVYLVGRVVDGIILLLVASALMAFTIIFFYGYAEVFHEVITGKYLNVYTQPLFGLSAFMGPDMVCRQLFEPLICTSKVKAPYDSGFELGMWIAYPIVNLALSTFLFICHEPSGEYFGKPGGINRVGRIIIHSFAAMLALSMGILVYYLSVYVTYIIFILVFVYGMFVVSYYLTFALYQKSFHLKGLDMLLFFIIVFGGIFVSIICAFLSKASPANAYY